MRKILLILIIVPFLLVSCHKAPRAHFYLSVDEPVVGQELLFHNDSDNGERYEWDFGDGYGSNEESPYHTFNSNGTFTVTLTVRSNDGDEDQATMDVTVYIPTLLEIEVREYYDDYAVPGASVLLYNSLADWDAADINKSVYEGITDSRGITVFANLDPFVYYLDVWEKNHDNYSLGYEDVAFIRTPEVMPHQINRFLALVDKADHSGTKGAKSAPRIKAIIRKASDRQQLVSGGTEGWRELYERRANK